MTWLEQLRNIETRSERKIESTYDKTTSEEKTLSTLDYTKMNDSQLIGILEDTLKSLEIVEELQSWGEAIEEPLKVAHEKYSRVIEVLSNRKLENELSLEMERIDNKLKQKFEKLGIPEGKETSDKNRQQ